MSKNQSADVELALGIKSNYMYAKYRLEYAIKSNVYLLSWIYGEKCLMSYKVGDVIQDEFNSSHPQIPSTRKYYWDSHYMYM